MWKQYEVVSSVVSADSLIAPAVENSIQRQIDTSARAADRLACVDCPTFSLCGIVAMSLGNSRQKTSHLRTEILDEYGVKIDGNGICADKLVSSSLSRNRKEDFWLLKADELTDSSLEIRTAQTVINTMSHIQGRINNGVVK